MNFNVRAITRPPKHHFFGYYDTRAWNAAAAPGGAGDMNGERAEKHRRVVGWLDGRGLDGVVLTRRCNFSWYTGGCEIMTHTGRWPTLQAEWAGQAIQRPDILAI